MPNAFCVDQFVWRTDVMYVSRLLDGLFLDVRFERIQESKVKVIVVRRKLAAAAAFHTRECITLRFSVLLCLFHTSRCEHFFLSTVLPPLTLSSLALYTAVSLSFLPLFQRDHCCPRSLHRRMCRTCGTCATSNFSALFTFALARSHSF